MQRFTIYFSDLHIQAQARLHTQVVRFVLSTETTHVGDEIDDTTLVEAYFDERDGIVAEIRL